MVTTKMKEIMLTYKVGGFFNLKAGRKMGTSVITIFVLVMRCNAR